MRIKVIKKEKKSKTFCIFEGGREGVGQETWKTSNQDKIN